jgi:N-acetylglucosaminyldiphosphoundecaprenol N-acetyl-beta-D-mannosaminyltransferase
MAALATTPVRARVLGIPVNVSNDVFGDAVALHGAGGGQIVTLNAEMTMAARADPALGAAIEAARMVIPDGAGVVWALGRQSHRVRRSPGIELARRLLEHAAAHGWRVERVLAESTRASGPLGWLGGQGDPFFAVIARRDAPSSD